MRVMSRPAGVLSILLLTIAAGTVVLGQAPPTNQQQGTIFRATTNFVVTDVLARDREGRFVPDLEMKDFQVLEDGVPQNITYFESWIGGRSLGNLAVAGGANLAASGPVIEGFVMPKARPKTDSSGRLFFVFIDDLHCAPGETPRMKDLLKKVRDLLIHDNDLVGFVSSGTSSIAIDPSYDYGHRRFNEAIEKVMGSAPTADEYIEGASTESGQGPQQVRFNAHTAFKTVYGLLDQLASVTERRKSLVYVSCGYNFNPFSEGRLKKIQQDYASNNPSSTETDDGSSGPSEEETLQNEDYHKRTAFSFADLTNEIAQLTREAQRANVQFYTLDPRGLLTQGGDASTRTQISFGDWRDFFQTQISTLRVLAEETGGLAGVESNDFERMIRRIDSDTSDFYRIGYNSSNPDPTKIRRFIKIESKRSEVQELTYRSEYTIPKTRR